jgi:hypothetical protein
MLNDVEMDGHFSNIICIHLDPEPALKVPPARSRARQGCLLFPLLCSGLPEELVDTIGQRHSGATCSVKAGAGSYLQGVPRS